MRQITLIGALLAALLLYTGCDNDSKKSADVDADDTASDINGDTASDPKGDTASDPKGDTASDPKGDTASDPKGDTASDPKGDSETESPDDSETESQGDSETKSPGDSETESLGDSETESPGDSETESPGDSETEPQGCASNADCTEPGLGTCIVATGECVACITDDHCSSPMVCHVESGKCVSCNTDDDCPGFDVCNDQDCEAGPWTCAFTWYGDGACDCGCGIIDIDCAGPESSYCDFDVTCINQGLEVKPDENWRCVVPSSVPGNWTCDPTYYDDDWCDCGCSSIDPDCAGPEADFCKENNCPGRQVPVADQNWRCEPPPGYCTNNGDCSANEECYDNACVDAVSCQNNGFVGVAQVAEGDDYPTNLYLYYHGETGTSAPVNRLRIEFYNFVRAPGTYAIGVADIDQNYATCENCIFIGEDCTIGIGDSCNKWFYGTAGTVEVTRWDSHFAGTLTNARLVEVTLGPNFVTTPVYNGETWCISSYSFNTAIDWD